MWRGLCLSVFCAALINADGFKRAEMSASPFVLSSRYGRSSPRMLTPRNDRFFMTGRYGKRSGQDTDGNYSGNRKLNFGISELINTSERDRNRNVNRDKEMSQEWRPKCDCRPYEKALMFRNYYKRNELKTVLERPKSLVDSHFYRVQIDYKPIPDHVMTLRHLPYIYRDPFAYLDKNLQILKINTSIC